MNGSYLLRSTLSWSATRCRSWAGRCWLCRVSPGAGSGTAAQSACGWRRSAGTGSAGAACPARTSCCTQTTPLYPSWREQTGYLSPTENSLTLILTELERHDSDAGAESRKIALQSLCVQWTLRDTITHLLTQQRLGITSMDTDCTIHGLKTYYKCYLSL